MLTPNTKVSIKDSDGSTYKEYRLDLKPKPNFTPSWQENGAWTKIIEKKFGGFKYFAYLCRAIKKERLVLGNFHC